MSDTKLDVNHKCLIVQVCSSLCGYNLQITVDCFEWGMFDGLKPYFELGSDTLCNELNFMMTSIV